MIASRPRRQASLWPTAGTIRGIPAATAMLIGCRRRADSPAPGQPMGAEVNGRQGIGWPQVIALQIPIFSSQAARKA